MKNISFSEGFPLIWQVFQAQQAAFKEAILGLTSGVGDCILSGVVIGELNGDSQFPVSAGWVILNGEVLRVPAHTIPIGINPNIKILYKASIDPVNYPIAHADQEVKRMQVEEVALIKWGVLAFILPGEVPFDSLKRLGSTQRTVILPEGTFDFNAISNDIRLSYQLLNGDCIIRGRIRRNTVIPEAGWLKVFTLPVGMRPRVQVTMKISTGDMVIETDGDVLIAHGTAPTPLNYNIGDIRFRVD